MLGYAKVVGTLVRAMRVLAVAIRAVPRAARVLRLAAVFLRSYEGRRRSKDLHEASIVIQRRAGRHMALKVRGGGVGDGIMEWDDMRWDGMGLDGVCGGVGRGAVWCLALSCGFCKVRGGVVRCSVGYDASGVQSY